MSRIIILMGLLGLSVFNSHSIMAQESATSPRLKVLSYNIRYLNKNDGQDSWENRKLAVVETIQTADVIGLQEVVDQQLDFIKRNTPDYQWYGVGRDDGKLAGEMTAIGWKTGRIQVLDKGTFWLSEASDKVGSKSWDAALPRIASWIRLRMAGGDKSCLLVNTHFDHRGAIARKESAKLLRAWIAGNRQGLPAILIGDLNAQLGSEPLEELLSNPNDGVNELIDARQVAEQQDNGPNSTWNGFDHIVDKRRIDHILVVGKVGVESFLTLDPRTEAGRFASDHLPVSAVLQLIAD
ncbi:MAG: endonuclease/exonuclease/phosphatase family protein [Planctomycetales bacterium]|nr:endonuclease/exonuclease/phosphatase family protein [Planctomycetales bacterium]